MDDAHISLTIPGIDIQYYISAIWEYILNHQDSLYSFIKSCIGGAVGLSIPISVFLFIGIIIAVEGIKSIRKKEEDVYYPKPKQDTVKVENEISKRWDMVKKHISSENQNDWRQAIMEADIILDDLLTKLGYKGDSIGEKLKRVSKGDFKTRQVAWDAHLVRNEIAHEGSLVDLNHIEAKRVIGLYRKVFEEFYHIQD